MHYLLDFLRTSQSIGFITSVVIFFITIFLVVKRWVGLSVAFILLLFSLLAGLAISNQQAIHYYLEHCYRQNSVNSQQAIFTEQIQQALTNLKAEMETDKTSLNQALQQVQELFVQVNYQRQKLEDFIEKTRDHFKTEEQTPSSSTSTLSSPTSNVDSLNNLHF